MTTPLNECEPQQVAQVAQWLAESRQAVAFTGAGISTESGIPDFRSPGGVWSKYRTIYFDEFMRSEEARKEYWRQKCEAHADMAHAQPNVAHRILARWEQLGKLRGVITQNIDGLHQLAGSRHVLELHGTARQVACMDCGWRTEAEPLVEQFLKTQEVPKCPQCGGRLKHATVSFGQALPEDVLQEAIRWASSCELFLAMGSSLVVEPAASLPSIAKRAGARLVIINRDPTPLDRFADLVLRGKLGKILTAVDDQFQKLQAGS